MTIPKILHQVWIGPLAPPQAALDSWKRLNPAWDYRLHRQHTGYPEELQSVLDAIFRADREDKWRAMTDAIRWWLLLKFGGIATDADSECIRSLDPWLTEIPGEWAAWENEEECPGIIANGTVGAEPGSLLMSRLVQRMPMRNAAGAPWIEFGPHYLTEEAYGYKGLTILPSRHFIPWHGGLSHPYGKAAPGDHVVYGRQFWGSRNGYRGMDTIDPRFVVLSTGVRIPEWAPCCLGSVRKQKFAVRQLVYTDRHTAAICRDVTRTYERGCLVDIRQDRGAALANIWEAMHELKGTGTKVIFCDLDDMLLEGALETVRDIVDADPNLRIGWGQFRHWPTGGRGFSAEIPEEVSRRRAYRDHPWVTSHLRWCDADLFCELDKSELQRADGSWLPYAGDCAMWWSMLERTEAWEQKFCRRELYAYNRRFVDTFTPEITEESLACEAEVRAKPRAPAPPVGRKPKPVKVRLNVGCGKLTRPGWVNLDLHPGPGVDVVCDLEQGCIPLPDNSVDEIRGDHVLEHIKNSLHAMQELWRVSKRGALATFVVPLGELADADPTHCHRFNERSWAYFGQPMYSFADYGYQGDWEMHSCKREGELMTAELRCVKPARRA